MWKLVLERENVRVAYATDPCKQTAEESRFERVSYFYLCLNSQQMIRTIFQEHRRSWSHEPVCYHDGGCANSEMPSIQPSLSTEVLYWLSSHQTGYWAAATSPTSLDGYRGVLTERLASRHGVPSSWQPGGGGYISSFAWGKYQHMISYAGS